MDEHIAAGQPHESPDRGRLPGEPGPEHRHQLERFTTLADESVDRLARLAARIVAAPVALIAVVDRDQTVVLSASGVDARLETEVRPSVVHAVSQHIVTQDRPLVIDDGRLHPLVGSDRTIGTTAVGAWLGVPLRSSAGAAIGSLSVIDAVPRRWTDDEIMTMRDLAALIITELEHRQTHAALRESEARFRVVVQRAVEGITILSAEGTVTYQSDSIRRTLGYDSEAFIGVNVFTRIHPDDVGIVTRTFAHLLDDPTARPVIQFRFRHADGSWRWLEAMGSNLLGDPAVRGIVISSSDMTNRLATNAALRESEERFRRAFDDAATGQALVGLDGRFLRVNASLCRMLGCTPDDLVGTHFRAITHPDDIDVSDAMRHDVTDAETSSVKFEKRYIHQDGHVVWVTVTSSAVRDQAGRPLYLVTQVQDITTLKEAQAEAVAEIARREEFLSIAAHELKTPITSIKASSQFLRRLLHDDGPDAHQLQRLVTQQHGQIGRLEDLVSDLLDVSRIQRGRLELRRERFALGDLVREVVERFHYAPEYTRHHHLAVADHGLVVGEWDRARLDQVVTNLVSNALKYSPDGGEVVVGVTIDRHNAVVTVRDHGIGIADEMLEQVFEPFARRAYHVPVMYGTGLGLYITRQIVEHHGGQISLASTPGQGTTVTVRLPRVVNLIA